MMKRVVWSAYKHVFKLTCHLHISLPSSSSLTTMKSKPPAFTPLQLPKVSPAKKIDPSMPIATSMTVPPSVVPSCRTCDEPTFYRPDFSNGIIYGKPDTLVERNIVVGCRRRSRWHKVAVSIFFENVAASQIHVEETGSRSALIIS